MMMVVEAPVPAPKPGLLSLGPKFKDPRTSISSKPAPKPTTMIKEGDYVLYAPGPSAGAGPGAPQGRNPVVIPAFLADVLKQHQKEAVAFLWRCLTGRGELRNHRGAILADEMGLGKTAVAVALIYLLTKLPGPSGKASPMSVDIWNHIIRS
jgi:hypothetical protein